MIYNQVAETKRYFPCLTWCCLSRICQSIQVSRKLSRSLYILTVLFIFYKTFFYWIECLYKLVILMICLYFIMSGMEWTIPFRSYWNQWIPLRQEWIDHFSLIGLKASLWQDWHVIPRLAVRNMPPGHLQRHSYLHQLGEENSVRDKILMS